MEIYEEQIQVLYQAIKMLSGQVQTLREQVKQQDLVLKTLIEDNHEKYALGNL